MRCARCGHDSSCHRRGVRSGSGRVYFSRCLVNHFSQLAVLDAQDEDDG